jgi:hypothetical protein
MSRTSFLYFCLITLTKKESSAEENQIASYLLNNVKRIRVKGKLYIICI